MATIGQTSECRVGDTDGASLIIPVVCLCYSLKYFSFFSHFLNSYSFYLLVCQSPDILPVYLDIFCVFWVEGIASRRGK